MATDGPRRPLASAAGRGENKEGAVDQRREEKIRRLREALRTARRVCVLTGAGVSAESGVPVYRGHEGLYQAFSAADMATPEGFARNPEKVWQWYTERRRQLLTVQPNAGHAALAHLQQIIAADPARHFHLVTQNIDNLHQAAGSTGVIELHGNLWQTRCTACGNVADTHGQLFDALPRCGKCGALCRPHIVWFGEMLDSAVWSAAMQAAAECDLFMAVGTSAVVQPAASLVHVAADAEALVVEINLEETPNTRWVDVSLIGPSGEILPRLVD